MNGFRWFNCQDGLTRAVMIRHVVSRETTALGHAKITVVPQGENAVAVSWCVSGWASHGTFTVNVSETVPAADAVALQVAECLSQCGWQMVDAQ